MIEYFIFELGCSSSEKRFQMRRKQQAYTHIVRSSKATAGKPYWNARHDVTGSDLRYLPPYYSLAVPYLKVSNNLSTTATVIKASLQLPNNLSTINQRLTSGVYKTDFLLRKFTQLIRPAHGWSLFLFGFCFVDIFWLRYVFLCYNKHFCLKIKMLRAPKKQVSIMATFLCPHSLRSKRSRTTSRMKSDRAKELVRIRAARKMERKQKGQRSGVLGRGKKRTFPTPPRFFHIFTLASLLARPNCSRPIFRAA